MAEKKKRETLPAVRSTLAALEQVYAAAQVTDLVFVTVNGEEVELYGEQIPEEMPPFFTPDELRRGVVVELTSDLEKDPVCGFEKWSVTEIPSALPRILYATYKLQQMLPNRKCVGMFFHIMEKESVPLENRSPLRMFRVTKLDPRQFSR